MKKKNYSRKDKKNKSKVSKKYQKLLKITKFLIKFNLFSIPLYLIILTGATWPALMRVTEGISFSLLRFIGVDASVSGGFIVVPVINGNFAATVSWDSTGWKSILAFFALVFATEFPLRKKLIGMLFIPVIYFVNILRIVFMFFFVSRYDVAYYNLLHATLWSWGLIITIFVLWAAWMKYVK
jgi:exosortase/archaeosortase family protein